MGLLGVSGHVCAGLYPPSSPPLDHGDLFWKLQMADLRLPGLWLVQEGLGLSTFSNTCAVNLPTSGKEPSSGHLWQS